MTSLLLQTRAHRDNSCQACSVFIFLGGSVWHSVFLAHPTCSHLVSRNPNSCVQANTQTPTTISHTNYTLVNSTKQIIRGTERRTQSLQLNAVRRQKPTSHSSLQNTDSNALARSLKPRTSTTNFARNACEGTVRKAVGRTNDAATFV